MLATLGEGLLEIGVDSDLPGDTLGRGFGGDAANVAVMAARMGARACLVTQIGDDAAGRLLVDFWNRAGVDVSHVGVDRRAATGLYTNELVPGDGHRFKYYRAGSAASRLGPDHLDGDLLAGLQLLHVTGITLSISDTVAAAAGVAAERARARGVPVSFDVNYRSALAPDHDELLEFARAADIVFLSVDDAQSLLGGHDSVAILEALGGHPSEVLMSDGGESAVLHTAERSYRVAPPTIDVVDAAGAGDALAGAYLASRMMGAAPAMALASGVAAASLSCRHTGCARAYPTADSVEAGAQPLLAAVETGEPARLSIPGGE